MNKIIYLFIAAIYFIAGEVHSQTKPVQYKTILLDGYFNHEMTKDSNGYIIQTHYLWNETTNGGFSFLGNIFNSSGIKTALLTEPVTAEKLKQVDIYFIVDPDCPKENPVPNYIMPEQANAIYNWVQAGGVLMLFSNDSGNVEFSHLNQLAEKFGIHFNEHHTRNKVKDDNFITGTINIPKGNKIFISAKNIFIKDICTLDLKQPAEAVLTDNGENIIAISKIGKGVVFAIGDPWLYNEYLDGKKLPKEIENHKAAEDLVTWLLKQIK